MASRLGVPKKNRTFRDVAHDDAAFALQGRSASSLPLVNGLKEGQEARVESAMGVDEQKPRIWIDKLNVAHVGASVRDSGVEDRAQNSVGVLGAKAVGPREFIEQRTKLRAHEARFVGGDGRLGPGRTRAFDDLLEVFESFHRTTRRSRVPHDHVQRRN